MHWDCEGEDEEGGGGWWIAGRWVAWQRLSGCTLHRGAAAQHDAACVADTVSSSVSPLGQSAQHSYPPSEPCAVGEDCLVLLTPHLISLSAVSHICSPARNMGKKRLREEEKETTVAETLAVQQKEKQAVQEGDEKKKKKRRKKGRRDAVSSSSAASSAPAPAKAAAPPKPSKPLPAVPKGSFTVFVGGLPYDVSKEQLTAFFQRDGCRVWGVRIANVKDGQYAQQQRGSTSSPSPLHCTPYRRCFSQSPPHLRVIAFPSVACLSFAHVEFEDEEQVARTLLRHGELWTDGEHAITVQLAKPKASSGKG